MKTLTIPVEGMTCGGCTSSVQRALARLDGVSKAEAQLQPGQAVIDYDPGKIVPERLIGAIEDAGFLVPADWQPPA